MTAALFTQTYKEYEGVIYKNIYRKVKNIEDAKDLVQECFIKLFTGLRKNVSLQNNKNHLKHYLFKTACTVVCDFVRRRQSSVCETSYDALEEAGCSFASKDMRVEKRYEFKEMESHISAVLAVMPRRLTGIFYMKKMKGYAYKHIKKYCGLTSRSMLRKINDVKNSVKMRLVQLGYDMGCAAVA